MWADLLAWGHPLELDYSTIEGVAQTEGVATTGVVEGVTNGALANETTGMW